MKLPASSDDPGEKLTGAGGETGKRVRAERRKRAAEVLRQALGDGGGDESATSGVAMEGEEARAVGLAREARQRAQETFVSRGVGAAIATEPAGEGGGRGKRVKAERRQHAAEVLRLALGDGDEPATPGVAVEGEEARVTGLTREARQRAQEA